MSSTSSDLKRFAGLDIAKESIYACVVDSTGFKAEKRFETKTNDLLDLSTWLKDYFVYDIALENTGIYSEPVINILRKSFKLNVVNASDTWRLQID